MIFIIILLWLLLGNWTFYKLNFQNLKFWELDLGIIYYILIVCFWIFPFMVYFTDAIWDNFIKGDWD